MAEWLARQIMEAFPWNLAPKYLIRDNDKAFGGALKTRVRAAGMRSGEGEFHILNASGESEIDAAFATLAGQRPDALMVGADPFFTSRRNQIVTLAARHAIPTIYDWHEYAPAGSVRKAFWLDPPCRPAAMVQGQWSTTL